MFCQVLGVNVARLLLAIAQVESGRGATSENVYQLRDIYLRDCNRILNAKYAPGFVSFSAKDKYDRHRSEEAMAVYWAYYGERYKRITGRMPDYEVFARIHNGGPNGFYKNSTADYWRRVQFRLERLTIDDGLLWIDRTSENDTELWRHFCHNDRKDKTE